jgi:type II secretory pathway predicted ATPase ExeA
MSPLEGLNLMYEPFFGLVKRPFGAAADADCYFPATAIEAARQTLFRAIDRGEGAGMLTGPAGTGKSLLLEVLAEQFRGRFDIAILTSGRLDTRRALLQAILFELSLPYRDQEEGELRLALIDHLSASENQREGLLLLVDEAHALPLRLLEELRMITNLVRQGQPKVRLVLAGSPAIEERFTSPKLDAFNQRITARCYLQAFDRNETRQYIQAQIEWAGGQPEVLFNLEALDAVQRATEGIPRLVNQVCDHALILACAAGASTLDKRAIEEAWADLQQLPTPWNNTPGATCEPKADAGEVIEFGVLEDEPGESATVKAIQNAPQDRSFADETLVFQQRVKQDRPPQEPPVAVPFTRPIAGSTSADYGRQDPLGCLSQVAQQLAAIDSEFETDPAAIGSGPQVDLSFGAAFDPFSESFTEEEIVIDPFWSSTTDALENRPLVHCDEGRKLGALLKPFADRASPKLSVATSMESDEQFEQLHNRHATNALAAPVAEQKTDFPAIIYSLPEECAISYSEEQGSDQSARFAPRSETGRSKDSVDDGNDNLQAEPDLIVIDDEPAPYRQVSVVRRGQYRQLFANLRRQ